MNVSEYINKPYTFITKHIVDESGDYYYITVKEFQGCQSNGETIEEAYRNIREAMELWIESSIEHNDSIPEPLNSYELVTFLARVH